MAKKEITTKKAVKNSSSSVKEKKEEKKLTSKSSSASKKANSTSKSAPKVEKKTVKAEKKVEKKETKKETQKPVTTKKGNYIGNIPKLPKTRSYYQLGDGYKTMLTHNGDVKNIQKALNWAINAGLKIDGCYGENTRKWVIKYENTYGLKADGFWGSKCNAKLQTITR